MAGSPVRKRTLKLALFSSGEAPTAAAAEGRSPRSPRSFDDGAVGLGIVAAMSGSRGGDGLQMQTPARSEPIPIVSPQPRVWRDDDEEEEDELSESYTCVISHVGGGPARKRVYFNDGYDGGGGGVFYQSPPPPPEAAVMPPAADFLSWCYLCKKKLNGLDIFMYRGEKAFCSVECRCQQILSDEYRKKCGSRALKSFEYYVSPYSAPLFFASRVAA